MLNRTEQIQMKKHNYGEFRGQKTYVKNQSVFLEVVGQNLRKSNRWFQYKESRLLSYKVRGHWGFYMIKWSSGRLI